METKVCSKCKVEKPRISFDKSYEKRCNGDDRRSDCTQCRAEYKKSRYKVRREEMCAKARNYRKKHPDRIKNTDLKQRFGITLEQYNNMLAEQNGVCAICKSMSSLRNLAVDHCHSTGKIRGLLCSYCNTGLGLFKDSLEILDKAKEYLNASRLK